MISKGGTEHEEVCAKMVPKVLSDEQKERRKE